MLEESAEELSEGRLLEGVVRGEAKVLHDLVHAIHVAHAMVGRRVGSYHIEKWDQPHS